MLMKIAAAATAVAVHCAGPAPMFGVFYGNDAATARQVDRIVRPAFVQNYAKLLAPVPLTWLRKIHGLHELPVVDIDPDAVFTTPGVIDHPPVSQILNFPAWVILQHGLDPWLWLWARAIRRLHYRVALSFAHEANGSWYAWGWAHTRSRMIAKAYRYVHRFFDRYGARNVIWVWTVNKIWHGPGSRQARRATHLGWPGRR